jgi:electron transport complex protein RnfC
MTGFAGGIAPAERKTRTAERPIQDLPIPERSFVPMRQHIGIPAEPVVRTGHVVRKGELIGASPGGVSAPVHAPTSGRVIAVGSHVAPHASGLSEVTVTIEADGRDEWAPLPPPLDPESVSVPALVNRIAESGIVGMGGATFPSAAKLDLRSRHRLHTLIVNGAECEPYLTADDRLMRENAAEIVEGIRIIQRVLNVPRVRIAIERNKPEALKAMRMAADRWRDIEVAATPARYPGGAEKQLAQLLTGRESPSQGLPADVGVIVQNVATAFAVREAVRFGRPLISRVVTVSGGAVHSPANLRVHIGTIVERLFDHCGGFLKTPARIVLGGPMMGEQLPSLE